MRRPLCVLFAGPVGSSKTPIAHYLSWNLGLPIFNNDALRAETQEDLLSSETDSDEYFHRRDERLKKLLSSGKDFVYDSSVDRKWGQKYPELARAGYRWFIISLDISFDFMNKLFEAKDYDAPVGQRRKWYEEHQSFLKKYGHEVGLSITDASFGDRLQLALEAVKRALRDAQFS